MPLASEPKSGVPSGPPSAPPATPFPFAPHVSPSISPTTCGPTEPKTFDVRSAAPKVWACALGVCNPPLMRTGGVALSAVFLLDPGVCPPGSLPGFKKFGPRGEARGSAPWKSRLVFPFGLAGTRGGLGRLGFLTLSAGSCRSRFRQHPKSVQSPERILVVLQPRPLPRSAGKSSL